jgi:glycine/D-amino acid oxidase-like deaminating enzyme
LTMQISTQMRVGIIGGGWNGCHLALELKKQGHRVSLFEEKPDIFQGVSGNFGIRLHKGPHYPRSKATRDSCRDALTKFCDTYPELVVKHESAIYAHGETDALGNRSKVSEEVFRDVCNESSECTSVDPTAGGYRNLISAYNLDEPSVAIGERLRNFFKAKLGRAGVYVHLNTPVDRVLHAGNDNQIQTGDGEYKFDVVINATGYTSLLPQNIADSLPVDIGITYQTCIALVYEDQQPQEKPLSFIVMDGWFPCVMPVIDSHETRQKKYILTHGSYTILGSFDRYQEGQELLDNLDDESIASRIKPHCEREITRFWPGFLDRFHYRGWKGNVLAKLKTTSEFRSSLTFEKDGVIHIFPGKVSNVVTAADEVTALINEIARRRRGVVRECNGVRFTVRSAFHTHGMEIGDKPEQGDQHTSNLQTYVSLVSAK